MVLVVGAQGQEWGALASLHTSATYSLCKLFAQNSWKAFTNFKSPVLCINKQRHVGTEHLLFFTKPERNSGTHCTTVSHPDQDLDLRSARHKALFPLSQKDESSSCAQEGFFQKMQDLALNHYTKNYWTHELEQFLFLSPAKWALNMGHKCPLTSRSGVPENLAVPYDQICFRTTFAIAFLRTLEDGLIQICESFNKCFLEENFNFFSVFPYVWQICCIGFLNKPFMSIAFFWLNCASWARATETCIWLGKTNVHVNFMFYLFLLNFDMFPGRSINSSPSPWLVHPNNDCWACKTNWARPSMKSRR